MVDILTNNALHPTDISTGEELQPCTLDDIPWATGKHCNNTDDYTESSDSSDTEAADATLEDNEEDSCPNYSENGSVDYGPALKDDEDIDEYVDVWPPDATPAITITKLSGDVTTIEAVTIASTEVAPPQESQADLWVGGQDETPGWELAFSGFATEPPVCTFTSRARAVAIARVHVVRAGYARQLVTLDVTASGCGDTWRIFDQTDASGNERHITLYRRD